MKNLQTFEEFLNESKEIKYTGDFTTFGELKKAIENLPSTATAIEVPGDLRSFFGKKEKFTPNMPNWKKKAITYLENTLKHPDGKKIDTFILKSYYGEQTSTKNSKADYYVKLSSEQSRKFSQDMSNGKFGSLD